MTASGGRRVAGWAALVAGLGASAAGVVLAVQAGRPVADTGVLPVAAPATTAADPARPGAADPARPTAADPARPTASAVARPTPRAATPVRGWAAPTRITIGALRVDAPVDPVGVTSAGALAVPGDPSRLGWWIGSAAPGSARGTVVLAGHVDTADQGPGALFRLERLPMRSTIAVRAAGHTLTYRAVARRSYPKQHLPADLFRPGTVPRLALVTCGGPFHDGAYRDNVVVYAEPVS